ncbi:RecB family exonuclease [Nocardia sp. NPDC001965]
MIDTRRHLSVSQYNQYKRCPYSYKLSRIDKVWQRPAAWLAQGSAVHKAVEETELHDLPLEAAEDVFRESYSDEVGKYTEATPNFNYWSRSGPYAGEADIERRYGLGLEQVGRYFSWREKHPEDVIWIAEDGTPGIEIGFDIDLDGVRIRGFIDQVLKGTAENEAIPRDIKSGNKPGDEFQLATYGAALRKQWGVEVSRGDYWMGRTGKPTLQYDLTEWPTERVAEEFHTLAQALDDADFEPDPEPSRCRFCDVSYHCAFRAG